MTEKTENNEENIAHVTIDISLSIEDGIDPKRATEYLGKLFAIGDKFGELLHKEGLTLGEALFVIYILEKGALSVIEIDDPDDIYHLLSADNKSRIDMMASMIIRHNVKKDNKEKNDKESDKEKGEQKN